MWHDAAHTTTIVAIRLVPDYIFYIYFIPPECLRQKLRFRTLLALNPWGQAFHEPIVFQVPMMNTSLNSFGMQPGSLGTIWGPRSTYKGTDTVGWYRKMLWPGLLLCERKISFDAVSLRLNWLGSFHIISEVFLRFGFFKMRQSSRRRPWIRHRCWSLQKHPLRKAIDYPKNQ